MTDKPWILLLGWAKGSLFSPYLLRGKEDRGPRTKLRDLLSENQAVRVFEPLKLFHPLTNVHILSGVKVTRRKKALVPMRKNSISVPFHILVHEWNSKPQPIQLFVYGKESFIWGALLKIFSHSTCFMSQAFENDEGDQDSPWNIDVVS